MNVLVYPSTHPHATTVHRYLSSILVPHYLPQIVAPDVFTTPEFPWHNACGLLVLLGTPNDHTGVRKFAEAGGRILALGVNAKRSQGLFGLHDTISSFGSAGLGLGLVKDTSIIRVSDNRASLHLSFPAQVPIPATVNHDGNDISVSRSQSATLDLEGEGIRVLGRYTDNKTVAGALSESGLIALWSCAPPLAEQLLAPTLSALGLRFEGQRPALSLLPQLLLAHPRKWEIQRRIAHTLFPDHDLEAAKDATQSIVFPGEHDSFRFHFPREIPAEDSSSDHPLFRLTASHEDEAKHVIVTSRSLTADQEKRYTPLFTPSVFFAALDDFRTADQNGELRMGDALLYGEVVTSTQTLLDKNPKLLRALPSPLLSLATTQVAGRGRGANAWLSPAGCMQMSLKLSIPLKSASSTSDARSIRPSNLVFIQYLFAIAVVEACQVLDPLKQWSHKVKLKWPNDIYGEFPAEEQWKKVELKKLGGILVNTSFAGSIVDVIIGCGLNVLNEPPIGSLAQLEAAERGSGVPSTLCVERVAAAVLSTFDRLWDSFLDQESEGFRPFMDQYTRAWLHSGQTVTIATTTPHTTVRIVGITPDHGLLRTEPLGGGQYIDLQPDGNSFDMMKGLIRTKTN